MLKKIFTCLSVVVVANCSTNEGGYTKSADVENRLLTLSSLEVVSKLGAPTETLKLNSDTQVWTYRSNSNPNSFTGGKCTVVDCH